MQDGGSFRYVVNFVSQSPNCAGSRSTSQRHSSREGDVLCLGCNDSRKKHLHENAVRLDAFNDDMMQRGIN
jgi:hypothetical protein